MLKNVEYERHVFVVVRMELMNHLQMLLDKVIQVLMMERNLLPRQMK